MSVQPHVTNPDHDYADEVDSHQSNISLEEHIKKYSLESFSDNPPESFWLSKDSEQDWFDQNAAMQRKTSMKLGFSAGKSNNKNSNLSSHYSFSTLNQKHKTSVLALPKSRKSFSADANSRPNNNNKVSKPKSRFTRSRSEPGRKVLTNVSEPGSPKVSCTGRVRSKSKKEREIRTGFWKKLRGALKIRSETKGVNSVRTVEPEGSTEPSLKRLATRRWSES